MHSLVSDSANQIIFDLNVCPEQDAKIPPLSKNALKKTLKNSFFTPPRSIASSPINLILSSHELASRNMDAKITSKEA